MNNFQTILVAIFLAFFVFGVLIFSGIINFKSTPADSLTGNVTIWGTLPSDEVLDLFSNIDQSNSALVVNYIEQKDVNYSQKLTESFAKDQAPDLFIIPSDKLISSSSYTYKIPYSSVSEKSFKDSFIDGADILLTKDGILGYPILVDPIVLYYNKNMLSNESILYPPSSWDELFTMTSSLNKKSKDGLLSQSMIALGQYDNVNHVKEILSTLLLQNNNPIVDIKDNKFRSAIKYPSPDGSFVLNQILAFFLDFSNPSKDSYSWNRSMPNSFDSFTADKLAFYLGYGSELFKIESVNPNLSFDVAMVPQTKGTNIKRTYGQMYTIVANKRSKNLSSALKVQNMIMSPDFLKELSIKTSLPSASRSLLAEKPKDPYLFTFFDSAIVSRTWLDPNKEQTDSIFRELIENSLSNKISSSEIINKANNQLDLLLKNMYE